MITDKDFTVTFFDVNGGDGFWIRYKGAETKFHNILLDGGYVKSYYGAFKNAILKTSLSLVSSITAIPCR
jgi:hypothetical protein